MTDTPHINTSRDSESIGLRSLCSALLQLTINCRTWCLIEVLYWHQLLGDIVGQARASPHLLLHCRLVNGL